MMNRAAHIVVAHPAAHEVQGCGVTLFDLHAIGFDPCEQGDRHTADASVVERGLKRIEHDRCQGVVLPSAPFNHVDAWGEIGVGIGMPPHPACYARRPLAREERGRE